MNEQQVNRAKAIIAEAAGKTAAHLRDADSLQTRAAFRYERVASKSQQNMDRLRAKSLNDILREQGDCGHLYLHPDNPLRNQLYRASRALNGME